MTTLDDLVQDVSALHGNQVFLIEANRSFTFDDFFAEARLFSRRLNAPAGKRFAFHARDSIELLVAWCGAALAGAETCVLNREYGTAEIRELAGRFSFDTVFSDDTSVVEAVPGCVPLQHYLDPETQPAPTEDSSGAQTVLVLTSGTTGAPKASRYTWENLIAQIRRSADRPGQRWLLAYHLTHFAGIQVLLHVLVNRGTLIIPASAQIADAAKALISANVEYVSATPTFWRFVLPFIGKEAATRIPLRQITLGGEAVSADLLANLRSTFPDARISQVFATTEMGSCFSVKDLHEGLPLSILERSDERDVQAKIVDGELHVRSRHGMSGYVGEENVSSDGWRSTGDLVEVRDGRIFFIGRVSETINVGGVKVHPLPIEKLISAVPGVRAVHCYGRPNPVTGQIVAVDVVSDENEVRADLDARIRTACKNLNRRSQPAIVRFVDSIATINRKIIRRAE